MLREKLYQRLGVRDEHSTNFLAATALVVISNIYAKRTGLEVAGCPVSSDGGEIIIFQHLDGKDIFRLMYASLKATRGADGQSALGRIPRGLFKSTLFGIPEQSHVRQKTGKNDILNLGSNLLTNTLMRFTLGAFLYGNGAIPVFRGSVNRVAEAKISKALNVSGEAVTSSIMESRDYTGGLKGLRRGAALLVQTYPDIPFQLVGLSREPHLVNISKPSTYRAIRDARGDLDLRELTMVLADGIVELLPERIQQRWRSGERQAEYDTLPPPKNRPTHLRKPS